jgi:ribose transport system ATP-binding protein
MVIPLVGNDREREESRMGEDAPAPSTTKTVRLAARSLSKTFGSAAVLRDVAFTAHAGEIHGLVGQNGSGKSTLIKIFSGVHAPDAGSTVEFNGRPMPTPVRPTDLRDNGVAFVHQDLGLVDECTVLENIRLGQFTSRRMSRAIDWRAERRAARATLERLHSDIDPARLVSTLGPGEKAVVAVGRALQSITPGEGCVVFDESTRALPRELLPDFYATVRRLAASGTAVIIVSHRLDEVLTLTDRVTVLQDGSVVAGGLPTDGLSEAGLARLLLGRELELLVEHDRDVAQRDAHHGRVRLAARGVSAGELRSFDLEVAGGEIVGVIGATGSGHSDVPLALAGAAADARGELAVDGVAHALPADARRLIEAGVVLVPEKRAEEGLALGLSAQENLTLPRVRDRGRRLLAQDWQGREFAEAVDMLGIVPARSDLPCASFSGGNQQKLLLAKWLLNRPRVLVLHEPTQAVDVGARMDILRAVRRTASLGVAVVIVSIEAQDLAAVCDRVVVMRDGVVAETLASRLTPDAITSAVYPVSLTAA